MRCGAVLAALSDFLDGELSVDVRNKIVAHLRGCDWCEHFGGRFSEVIGALRRELGTPAPIDAAVALRLRDRLAKEDS